MILTNICYLVMVMSISCSIFTLLLFENVKRKNKFENVNIEMEPKYVIFDLGRVNQMI